MLRKARSVAVVFFLLGGSAFAECKVDRYPGVGVDILSSYRGDINHDMGEYGHILDDSQDPNCARAASERLHNKIARTIYYREIYGRFDYDRYRKIYAYQDFVEGTHVSLIFASALVLGEKGELHTWLDQDLIRVRDLFYAAPYVDSPCGFSWGNWRAGNTCMDDYAVNASAFGWIAAYEAARGRPSSIYADAAKRNIDLAFGPESICISNEFSPQDAQGRGPCNTTDIGELSSQNESGRTAKTFSLNHGTQSPTYGAGLLTLISGALRGLKTAGYYWGLTYEQKVIARALIEEAQRKTIYQPGPTFSYRFKNNCAIFENMGGVVTQTNNQPCDDTRFDYYPEMFPLNHFYNEYVNVPWSGFGPPVPTTDVDGTQGSYAFNSFDSRLWVEDPATINNPGRRATYGDLGWGWLVSPPLFSGDINDNIPIGYLDGIDSQGVAIGWTCDRDTPDVSLRVQLSDGTTAVSAEGYANLGSEQAVNDLCGGGWAHRFAIQLPWSTRGRVINAYGLESRGQHITHLTSNCPEGSCSW